MFPDHLIPLTLLPPIVQQMTGRQPPSYQLIRLACINGRIPHERSVSNRLAADPIEVCRYFRLPIINPIVAEGGAV
jgi:hypothetical protein